MGGVRVFLALACCGALALLACTEFGASVTQERDAGADAVAPSGDDSGPPPPPIEAGGDGATPPPIVLERDSCPRGRGPLMERLFVPGRDYCVDVTEVTQAQYETFLLDTTTPRMTTPTCFGKDSYVPGPTATDDTRCTYAPASTPTVPVVCVDWCDAFSFCAWAGKRLCRGIATDAGVPDGVNKGSLVNEWSRGCNRDGANSYTYGPVADSNACNTTGIIAEVGSFPRCRYPDSGILDLGANVQEWEGVCGLTVEGPCRTRGADFATPAADTQCDREDNLPRRTRSVRVGFRCCADVTPK